MTKLNYSFNPEDFKKGDKGALTKFSNHIKDNVLKNAENGQNADLNLSSVINALSINPDFKASFQHRINQRAGRKIDSTLSFALDSAEADKQTDRIIEPIVDAMIRTNEILDLADMRTIQPNNARQLLEKHFQRDGQNLTEVQAGTDGFRITRESDELIAKTKVQASTEITELALTQFNAFDLADFIADLTGEVSTRMKLNMLYAGQGVANGTARTTGLWRGIDNNYGVNGIGDASNFIGAVKYGTKTLADAAIVAKGGVASDDAYDLCVKVARILTPRNVDTSNQAPEFVFIMSNATWGIVSTAEDTNGRFKGQTAIDPTTGKPIKLIDGNRVIIDDDIEAKFVFFVPRGLYRIYTTGGIQSLTDNGLVQLREGKIVYVARTFAVGSLLYGHKYLPDTDATIGTTAIDNQDRNAWRYFRID